MTHCGNNNDLALQHGGFCTMWSFVAKALFACPHANDYFRIHPGSQGSSAIRCPQSMRHRKTRPASCAAMILVYCSVRDWTRLCYVTGLVSGIHLSTRSRIRCGYFPLTRADLKISRFAVKFAWCEWTEAVSGKKKLRIQKYLDTCGGGLRKKRRTELVKNLCYM